MAGGWNSAGISVVAWQASQATAWGPGVKTFRETGFPQLAQAPLASQNPVVRPFTALQGWRKA